VILLQAMLQGIAEDLVPRAAIDPQRSGGWAILAIVSDQASTDEALVYLTQQEADSVAIEDRTTRDIHSPRILDQNRCWLTQDLGHVQSRQRAILALAKDDCIVRCASVSVSIAWVAIEIIWPDDDMRTLLD
jgi:hypothetical protein